MFLLHSLDVDSHAVLPRELDRDGEVIDLLVGVKSLVEVVLALGVGPQHVPVVPVSLHEPVQLEQEADQL